MSVKSALKNICLLVRSCEDDERTESESWKGGNTLAARSVFCQCGAKITVEYHIKAYSI